MNYHRIGDVETEPYDRGVYSCGAQDFEDQIKLLKKLYPIIGVRELASLLHKGGIKRSYVVITFDDGYLDNFTTAFPILSGLSIPAVFYLVTSLVGTSTLPWWDQIAYLVRNARCSHIRLTPQFQVELGQGEQREVASRQILRFYKASPAEFQASFMVALQEQADVEVPPAPGRRFLGWEEASRMLEGGMEMGSHTATHRILSKLSYEEQLQELAGSRQELEARLNTTVNSIAYPVGSRHTYNSDTFRAAQAAGYQFGLSFEPGANYPASISPYELHRIQPMQANIMRLQLAVLSSTGKNW